MGTAVLRALTAAKSRIRYVRVMGLKEERVPVSSGSSLIEIQKIYVRQVSAGDRLLASGHKVDAYVSWLAFAFRLISIF